LSPSIAVKQALHWKRSLSDFQGNQLGAAALYHHGKSIKISDNLNIPETHLMSMCKIIQPKKMEVIIKGNKCSYNFFKFN
jgi:hypothetical protein